MINRILNLFKDPEDRDPMYVQQVRSILIFSIVATAASILVVVVTANSPRMAITLSALAAMVALEVASFLYARRGSVLLAKLFVPAALIFAITTIAFYANSIHDISIIGYPLIIIIANLLQGRRSIYITTPLVIFALAFLGIADMSGWTTSPLASRTGWDDILIGSVLISAGSAILNQLVERFRQTILKAEMNERAQIEANKELKSLQGSLEERVIERTTALELANQRNQKRARQFEAIAQVTRAAVSIQDEKILLDRLVHVISEQFGFYHTGIFIVDEERENAVLRAANSEGGKRMLERGHKLKIGQVGIVGYVTASGNPRIALDVGADAVFFNNPDLPNTRSELALPIQIGKEVIGALDVQSTEANAFQQEDAEVLTTLVDQIAIAIQNARSYAVTQELLAEAQKVSGSFLKESWRALQEEQIQVGYLVSKDELKPLQKPVTSEQIRKAIEEKGTVTESGKAAVLAVPILLRDEIVGVMDIHAPEEHDWDPDEVDIVESVAERLSLAIESSLLLRTTQRRAEIERLTAEISGRISSTTQFDSILRTAAEELSQALGGSEVLVQIQPLDSSIGSGRP